MANLHIRRDHSLGLAAARKIAFQWAERVEQEFDMECTYEEGEQGDVVSFVRTGVSGTLRVAPDHFDLDAKLGFLLGAFKDRIEAQIIQDLDQLLVPKAAAKKKPSGK